jgi:hypothetical protein
MDLQEHEHPIKFKIKVIIKRTSFYEVELALEEYNLSKFLETIITSPSVLDNINCPVMKLYKGSQPCVIVFFSCYYANNIQFVLCENTIQITNKEGVVGFVFDDVEQNYRIEIATRGNTIFSMFISYTSVISY